MQHDIYIYIYIQRERYHIHYDITCNLIQHISLYHNISYNITSSRRRRMRASSGSASGLGSASWTLLS